MNTAERFLVQDAGEQYIAELEEYRKSGADAVDRRPLRSRGSSSSRRSDRRRFHPTFGIHHRSQLNAFNLADDLIEPFRAIVDLTAHQFIGPNVMLLQSDGYLRIAPEVYMRVVPNRKAAEKHFRRIDEKAPKTGTVRLLRLTEKQFGNIYYVTGEGDRQEKTVGAKSVIML